MARSSSLLDELASHVDRPVLVESGASVGLPDGWDGVLRSDRRARLRAALALWKPFADVLPEFTVALAEALRDVACVRYDRKLHLVYEVEISGARYVYTGRAPRARVPGIWTPVHAEHWASVDERLRGFYRTLHDGFVFLPGDIWGPMPLEDVPFDIVVAPSGPRPAMILFSNGADGTLAVGGKGKAGPDGFAQAPSAGVHVEGSIWELLDGWMTIGIKDE